jgi:predicted DNA-binding transcriptional regulator AlpA
MSEPASTSVTAEDWIDVRQLAERLGVREVTVRNWRNIGKGPKSFKLGGGIRFLIKDVDAWVKQQQQSSASE